MAAQLGHSVQVFFKDYAAWIHGESNARELDKIEAKLGRISPALSQKIPETR